MMIIDLQSPKSKYVAMMYEGFIFPVALLSLSSFEVIDGTTVRFVHWSAEGLRELFGGIGILERGATKSPSKSQFFCLH